MQRMVAARRRDRERGAALIEFSLVAALFVMILYGLIAFGMALAFKHTVTQAAAQGARAAVGAYSPLPDATDDDHYDAKIDKARQTVIDQMSWVGSRFDPAEDLDIGIDWCDSSLTNTGDPKCITVRIEQNYEERPIVPTAPGLGVILPEHLISEAIVEVTL
jgi:hypothetical protein